MTPLERIELLCDEGSVRRIRSGIESRRMGDKTTAGDGVVGAAGSVDGRPVFCYAQDARFVGGSLGEAHADTIVRVMHLAGAAEAPVVGFIESGVPGCRRASRHSVATGASSTPTWRCRARCRRSR